MTNIVQLRRAPQHTCEQLVCPECAGNTWSFIVSAFPITPDSKFNSADMSCPCGFVLTVGVIFPEAESED